MQPLPRKYICHRGALCRLTNGTAPHAGMGSFCLQLVQACRPLLLIRHGRRKQENRAPASTSRGGHGFRRPCRSGLEWPSRPARAPFGFTDQSRSAVSAAKKVLPQDLQAV